MNDLFLLSEVQMRGSSHIFRARMAPIARMRLVNTLPKARSLSRTIYVQNGFESCLFQPSMQPLRQRPRLKSDLFYRKANRLEERNQGVMLARDLRLFHDLSLRVHNAHDRQL